MKTSSLLSMMALVLVFTLLITDYDRYDNRYDVGHDATSEDNTLPTVGSYKQLKELIKDTQHQQGYGREFLVDEQADASATIMKSSADTAVKSSSGGDYSTTNVQVQGVDEADMIKTDGKYIYQVSQGSIIISEVHPANQLKVVNIVEYAKEQFYPQEIYVDDNHLVVIGTQHYYQEKFIDPPAMDKKITTSRPSLMPYQVEYAVSALIYDHTDKANLDLLREVEMEGNYISSRKMGSSLYLISNKYIDYYRIMNEDTEMPAPSYRDSSAANNQFQEISYDDIRYFPGQIEPNYLIVAGINLDQPDQEAHISSYLGSGSNIYASQDHLYSAVTQYHYDTDQKDGLRSSENTSTKIFKFALDQGIIEYMAAGEVPGTILNQFSMDEYDGHFRMATTKGQMWRDDEFTSKNNIYVLDEAMKITGQIEDIAPGERIYSARFMGKRGYMVTFKSVDPLFVLDLENPKAPKILGELKIPGYSDYLHPYDENHLIGFGMDTIEMERKDNQGNVFDTVALTQGMKIAIFDVSDVANPKEKFTEKIGDRGTYSDLLHNHKALLFSKEKNLLSFPVSVMKNKSKQQQEDRFLYGELTFQGAYVYHLDMENGFKLRGGITHLDVQNVQKDDKFRSLHGNENIHRILYIDDTLYTVSDGMIKASDIDDLSEIGSLKLK